MPKHAKLTNLYAANQRAIGVAVQSNNAYLPLLSYRALAGIAARQITQKEFLFSTASDGHDGGDTKPKIVWVGDLDRDGDLDAILSSPDANFGFDYRLYLSGSPDNNKLLYKVAQFAGREPACGCLWRVETLTSRPTLACYCKRRLSRKCGAPVAERIHLR